MSGQFRKLSGYAKLGIGIATETLHVSVSVTELDGIDINHLARIVGPEGHPVALAIVAGIDRSGELDLLVYDRLPDRLSCSGDIEIDLNSRWIHSGPRRGIDLPWLKARPTTVPGSEERRPASRVSPFLLASRPLRKPASHIPNQLVGPLDPTRTITVNAIRWRDWALATTTSETMPFRHTWETSLRLVPVAAPERPMSVFAPCPGVFTPTHGLFQGCHIEAGSTMGSVQLTPTVVRLLTKWAADDLDRPVIQRILSQYGLDCALIETLIADPTIRSVAVIAPCTGVILVPPVKVELGSNTPIANIEAKAHTMAYGTVPGLMPIPRQVDVDFRLGNTHVAVSSMPLVEINATDRHFGLPLGFSAAADLVHARLISADVTGKFVAVPNDCVMSVHRSTEVLVHAGAYTVTRHPVRVEHRDQNYTYLTGLPEGVDVVRDLEVVSKLFAPIRSVMLGLANL